MYKVDLHVHTPSSKDYNQSEKNDYLDIVRNAKENGIDLICITDHSSVKGFQKLKALLSKYQQLLNLLKNPEITTEISVEEYNKCIEKNVLGVPGSF